MTAFHHLPTVVLPPAARAWLDVHFLPIVLTHVADVEVAGLLVEREAPGIAHPVRPYLRRGRWASHKGVARGDAVREPVVHVDAEDLSQELGTVLGVPRGIHGTLVSAVPGPAVQVAVGAEHDQPAVVVGERRVIDQNDRLRGGGVGDVRVRRRDGIARYLNVAAEIRVVNEELAVVGVVGVERHAEHAALAGEQHDAADVQERGGEQRAVANHFDPAWLLHDEQPGRVSGRLRDVERASETARDELQAGSRGHDDCGTAAAGVTAAGELARVGVARDRLDPSEVQVALLPALDVPARATK